MPEEKNEKVIELDYLETPKGPVARFDGVKQLAELIVEVYEEIEKLNAKLNSISREEKAPQGFEEKLRDIENQLTILSDDMREVLNALGELSATVAQIRKALKL
ncbi:MAG: hypothetical protein NZ919_01060 [Candidatus Caldarchaeum sp.]|nr:hypothetical protein [Candidatus Caldarchaeum sp.]